MTSGPPRPGCASSTGGVPPSLSIALALAYGLYIALRTYEVDLGVYLRLGGRYVFTSHLYSFVLPNTSLPFTYPPFAALLFAPWQRTFSSVALVQAVWTMCNLAALVGVLVLSLRLVKPSLDRVATWRLALALSLPALLLNPVLITIGFGQVNLFVTFLVMWDLLSERKIGKRQLPLGVATGAGRRSQAHPAVVRSLFAAHPTLARRDDLCAHLRCVRTGDFRGRRRPRRETIGQRPSSSPAGPAISPSSTTRTCGGYSIASRTASCPMPSCSRC